MAGIDIAILSTHTDTGRIANRPMSNNSDVRYDGTSYYFPFEQARTVADIQADPVALGFAGTGGIFSDAIAGSKRSHWMWFIFPQVAGLGFSAMAQRFSIGSRAEATAYLAHDILGPRLIESTRLVMAASEKQINDILGSPDDMTFRSSMTLFDAVSKQEIFAEAIGTFSIQTAGTRRRSKSCEALATKGQSFDRWIRIFVIGAMRGLPGLSTNFGSVPSTKRLIRAPANRVGIVLRESRLAPRFHTARVILDRIGLSASCPV